MPTGVVHFAEAMDAWGRISPPAFNEALAFDRASVRFDDKDGRLHVAITPISKAAVNDYIGKEIPGWEELGLQPDRIYKMLRDPQELAKAAGSFNNLPILSKHQPTSAMDHPRELTEGSTGTDAVFKDGYLWNSLVAWTKDAIRGIQSGESRQLSSGYHYTPDMTPGVWNGQRYDGVMRSIIGNHVAFVREGRAGPDVMVMDSSEELQWQMIEKALRVGDSKENLKMKPLTRKAAAVQGALVAFLAPKLAHDEKVDFTNILASVTAENYDSRRPELLRSVSRLIEGKLAQDASAEGLSTLLEALSGVKPMEGKDDEGMATAPNAGLPVKPVRPTGEGEGSGARMMDRGSDAEDPRAETGEDPGMGTGQGEEDPDQGGEMSPAEQIKAWFQQNLTPEQCQAFEQFMATLKGGMGGGEEEAPGLDEEPDTLGTEEAKGPKAGIGQVAEQPKDGAYGKDKRSMKPAMDEATVRKTVDAAVLAEREVNRLTREAYNFVEPWVGKIKMALDTAEAVHRQALKMRNVDVSKIKDPAALPIVLSQLCKIGEEGKRVRLASMAADAAPEDYDSKWGLDAVKIRRVA